MRSRLFLRTRPLFYNNVMYIICTCGLEIEKLPQFTVFEASAFSKVVSTHDVQVLLRF